MYRERVAPRAFARWVECVWSLESGYPIPRHRVAPDGCLDLIYDRGNSLRVIGAMTAEQRFAIAAGTQLIGLRFRPGMARAFFGISAAELTDKAVAFEDLQAHPARELKQKLDDANSADQAVQTMLGILGPPPQTSSAIEKSIEMLVASHGSVNLDQAARSANLSARQFRRRCLEESGLSPKLLSRILRFRYASRLASAARPVDWSAIAADAGYFDQSHLIRDFRDFTRLTPVSAFSNTRTTQSA